MFATEPVFGGCPKKIKTFLTAVRMKQLALKAQMEGSNEAHVIVRSARRFENFTRKCQAT